MVMALLSSAINKQQFSRLSFICVCVCFFLWWCEFLYFRATHKQGEGLNGKWNPSHPTSAGWFPEIDLADCSAGRSFKVTAFYSPHGGVNLNRPSPLNRLSLMFYVGACMCVCLCFDVKNKASIPQALTFLFGVILDHHIWIELMCS